MKEDDIAFTLSVDSSRKEIEELERELIGDPEIEEVDLQEDLGIGEAILIQVLAGLLLKLLSKAPKAIRRLEKLIQRILKRAEKASKDETQPKLVVQVKFTLFVFRSSSMEDIKKEVKQIADML